MHCLGGGRHNDPWWNWQEMWRCWRIESGHDEFNGAKEWKTHFFGMQWWKWKEKQENSTLVFFQRGVFFPTDVRFFLLILERLAIPLKGETYNLETLKEAHLKAGPEFFAKGEWPKNDEICCSIVTFSSNWLLFNETVRELMNLDSSQYHFS